MPTKDPGGSRRVDVTKMVVLALAALGLLLLALQVLSIYTEAINWDEFALGRRAERTITTGRMHGGGRPGLGVLAIVPFVKGCTNAVTAIQSARLVWVGLTALFVAGLFMLLREVRRDDEHPWHGATAAVGLLVLVPVFLRWSLHVRTDHIALVGGLWGSFALVRSIRSPWWAVATCVCFAVGLLGSQKVIYVAALGFTLAGGQLLTGGIDWSRERKRVGALAVGGALGLVVYRFGMPLFYEPQSTGALEGVGARLESIKLYRNILGFRVYRMMLPTLIPHLALGGLLVFASACAARGRDHRTLRRLAVAWAVLGLGLAVALFHASAFPYFWLTVGLFPCAAVALAWEPMLASVKSRAARQLIIGGVCAALLVQALPAALSRLDDTQATQRDTFAFIERALPEDVRGFQVHAGMFCRADPQPMPTYFAMQILAAFDGAGASDAIRAFMGEFVSRPISFVIHSYNMGVFPLVIERFWNSHYVPYHGPVMLAGQRVSGQPGRTVPINIIAPGPYRWISLSKAPTGIELGDKRLDSGQRVMLARGRYSVKIVNGPGAGILVYAVNEQPAPSPGSFYSPRQIKDLAGVR